MTYDVNSPAMTLDTLFDVASVTKVLATTTALAQLYQKNLIHLDTKVGDYFPEFNNQGKDIITIKNLLLHNAGFHPDPIPGFHSASFGCEESQKQHPELSFSCLSKIFDGIMQVPLQNPVGSKYVYSDLSMMTAHLIIGNVVKANNLVQASDLKEDCPANGKGSEVCYYEAYVRKHILQPLGLNKSTFLPDVSLWDKCAPAWDETVYRHKLIQGFVSDPNAYANGGIMGHAGLFSTVTETFAILRHWMFNEHPDLLNANTTKTFIHVANTTQSSRALGWDTNLSGYGSCGHLSSSTYLHTGYTGTLVCSDIERDVITILYTNRVYPDESNTKISTYRPKFNDAVLCTLEGKYC